MPSDAPQNTQILVEESFAKDVIVLINDNQFEMDKAHSDPDHPR
jgi:hypothetical protein